MNVTMINPRKTGWIATVTALIVVVLVGVMEYVFDELWYANVITFGVVFPLCGLIIYIAAFIEPIPLLNKRIMVFVGSMLTGVGLFSSGFLIGEVEGFLAFFFSIILMVVGVIEIASGIFYVWMGDRLIIAIRNATWRGEG